MDLGPLIIILLVFILIFFVCRELLCWYWKINKSIELQQDILNELRKLNNNAPVSSASGEKKY